MKEKINKSIKDWTLDEVCEAIAIVQELVNRDVISVDTEDRKINFSINSTIEFLESKNLELLKENNALKDEIRIMKLYNQKTTTIPEGIL